MAVTMRWVQLFLGHWLYTEDSLDLCYLQFCHVESTVTGGCRSFLPENITKLFQRMSLCI